MNSFRTKTILVLLAVIITSISMANKPNEGEGINITVSPSTLVLSRDIGCVTVHSNIPFDPTADYLNLLCLSGPEGLESPYLAKADSCGELVLKFDGSAIKTIVGEEPGQVELTLVTPDDQEPSEFIVIASDTIRVKE